MVYGTFETSEYYASKGLVTPWQRNRKPTLMNKEKRGGKRPEIGDWQYKKKNGGQPKFFKKDKGY